MDLEAVRTFVIVAEQGQFQEAAAELDLTQQAVSKRISALEAKLGVRLFTRTARGATVTIDGQAFLPHARSLLAAAERAAESVRPGSRALRVDVLGTRLASAGLLQEFHRRHPDIPLDVVRLQHAAAALAAVRDGTIDAAFCCLREPLPGAEVGSMPVLDEALELLTGPGHAFAGARTVSLAGLAGHRIWIPGIVAGTEWAAFYEDLGRAFGLRIDATGPDFGPEHLFDMISDSPTLATFMGAGTRLVWSARHDLRRVPVRGPVPVYPWSLIWRADNRHPGLAALRDHLGSPPARGSDVWAPEWA